MYSQNPETLEIDATIRCTKEWIGTTYHLKDARWIGGQTAGIADSLMRDFNPGAEVGQHFKIADLNLVIVARKKPAMWEAYWLVRQA